MAELAEFVAGVLRTREAIIDRDMEFPRIDDRRITAPHRTVATVGRGASNRRGLDGLWFFDPDTGTGTGTGTEACWDPDVAMGEPIFMTGAEHDYWGAYGTDPATMTSRFYILPGDDPASGPLAAIELPIRVPAGLHGAWLSD